MRVRVCKINKWSDILKILFIILSLFMVIPSIMYLLKRGTILGFDNYYNFFINEGKNKALSTTLYLLTFLSLSAIYLYFINKKDSFNNIKRLIYFVSVVSMIFIVMTPWHSSDIFYYMGVGELNSVYGRNPYYETINEYVGENINVVKNDTIIMQGFTNYWSNSTTNI